jgi:hypothetical protein
MGSGVKRFQAFEFLTAADVNDYLMEQSVMVFDGAAARDAAIGTGVSQVELAEGMFVYLSDLNQYQMNLNGTVSGWYAVAGQMPRIQLRLGSAFSTTSGNTSTITGWTVTNNSTYSESSGVVTVPFTGKYNVSSLIVHAASNTTGGRGTVIIHSAGGTYRNTLPAPQSAAHSQSVWNTLTSFSMTAGDTLTFQAYQNSGGSSTVTTDSIITIEYVGP